MSVNHTVHQMTDERGRRKLTKRTMYIVINLMCDRLGRTGRAFKNVLFSIDGGKICYVTSIG